MKLTNSLLTLGLGIGLCAVSTTALAHGDRDSRRDELAALEDFSTYDRNGDGRVTVKEMESQAILRTRVEFPLYDLNHDNYLSASEQELARRGEECDEGPRAQVRYQQYPHFEQLQPVVRARVRYAPRWPREHSAPVVQPVNFGAWQRMALAEARRTFHRGDLDRDGSLSRRELIRVLHREATGSFPRYGA